MDAVRYEVRVLGGRRDDVLAAVQAGWSVLVDPARTVVRTQVADQAELAGMLIKIRLLGLELVEVRRLPQGGQPCQPLMSAP